MHEAREQYAMEDGVAGRSHASAASLRRDPVHAVTSFRHAMNATVAGPRPVDRVTT